jgi:hypothetical protein
MKTSSGTFALVVFAVIVTLAVVSCVTHQFIANQQAFLEIGTETTYVKWKQPDFDDALRRVCRDGGDWDLTVLNPGGTPIPHYRDEFKPCPPPTPGSIRTVKVTKSKIADKIVAGESVANDPNVMHHVVSQDPQGIGQVANALRK